MKKHILAAISIVLVGGAAAFAQATYNESESYKGKQIGTKQTDKIGFWGATPGVCLTAPAALTNDCTINEIVAAVNLIRSNSVARGLMK